MRGRRFLLALVAVGLLLVLLLFGASGSDAVLVVFWVFAALGILASAVALGVVAARTLRAVRRREAHGAARPWRWWGPVLAAGALAALVGFLLLAGLWPLLLRIAPAGGWPGKQASLFLLRALVVSLAPAGLVAVAAAGAGTLAARDGTRTRLAPVLLGMGAAGVVPPMILLLAGWFGGTVRPLLVWGALVGYPLLAAWWTHRHRAPGAPE